jgi:hypothetical protein
MTVLYRNGKGITEGHHDHAHFSNGCVLPGGRKDWSMPVQGSSPLVK